MSRRSSRGTLASAMNSWLTGTRNGSLSQLDCELQFMCIVMNLQRVAIPQEHRQKIVEGMILHAADYNLDHLLQERSDISA